MAILELIITDVLVKANRVIKIDMVKPILPKNPAPVIWPQFKLRGNAHRPDLTPAKEKSQMPRGLPIKKPAMIPIV